MKNRRTMQVNLINVIDILISNRAGGIWFALGGIGGVCVAARFVTEVPSVSVSHWLKVSSLSALVLGFLGIGLERLWYPIDSKGQSQLPQHGLRAIVLLTSGVLILIGGILLITKGFLDGAAQHRAIYPPLLRKHKRSP